MPTDLYKFKCQYGLCGKEISVELPESSVRTKLIIYCPCCGRAVQTEATIEIKQGTSWLPCIDYTGPGSKLTSGPVPDDIYGVAWGEPDSNKNISENEFINKYKINPRIEWCNRQDRSSYGKMCKDAKEGCKGQKAKEYKHFDITTGHHHPPPRDTHL